MQVTAECTVKKFSKTSISNHALISYHKNVGFAFYWATLQTSQFVVEMCCNNHKLGVCSAIYVCIPLGATFIGAESNKMQNACRHGLANCRDSSKTQCRQTRTCDESNSVSLGLRLTASTFATPTY